MITEEPLYVLPASALRSLIFGESGDMDIPKIPRPLSATNGDIAKIAITHWAIGALIKQGDPNEDYFHVELYPPEDSKEKKSHAELWLSFEWAESNARRQKVKAESAARTAHTTRINNMVGELTDILTATKLPEVFCKMIALQIATNYKTCDLSSLISSLDQYLEGNELHQCLAKYNENTKKEETSSDSDGSSTHAEQGGDVEPVGTSEVCAGMDSNASDVQDSGIASTQGQESPEDVCVNLNKGAEHDERDL